MAKTKQNLNSWGRLNLDFPTKILRLLREVGLIALFIIVGYLLVCLASYSPSDPGPMHTGSGTEIANLGGRVGAWIADLLFAFFGNMAYLFVLLVPLTVWRILREKAQVGDNGWSYLLAVVGFVLALIGACGLEQLYFPNVSVHVALVAGGIIGEYAGQSFRANFGLVGASVILLGLLITGITLVGHVSWFSVMDRIGYAAFTLATWCQGRIEEIIDRHQGAKVRQQRKVAVTEFRRHQSTREPPRITPQAEAPAPSAKKQQAQQIKLFAGPKEDGGAIPELSLLDEPAAEMPGYSQQTLESMSQMLVKKLKDFKMDITVEAVQPGPVITRFEIDLAPGIKASQVVGLARDLARSLSVVSVRVVENIPGKTFIGIEIPNQDREMVRLVEGLASKEYEQNASPLTLVLGKDIAGHPVITDLTKMPHVLIAGTTGSGKSVCVNALILSLVYKATPEQVRMIMVDPKFLELSVYDGIPHLLTPVVTDMDKAANALRWCIGEMDRRFRLMAAVSVRNISGFNKKIQAAARDGTPLVDPTAEAELSQPLEALPYIVVVVDELADLMMVAGKKIEEIIIRIAQRARAAGIHLVLATQRPSVDVVTGLIKANVPTRIAFQVSSRADSRTVLDQMGAEQLLGQGDMLFLPPGSGFTQRVHGSFVSDEEVGKVVARLKAMGNPIYWNEITTGSAESEGEGDALDTEGGEADPLYDEAVRFVTQSRKASISSVQRVLRVGYNRAARMIETMEQTGVVSSADNGRREVLAAAPPED